MHLWLPGLHFCWNWFQVEHVCFKRTCEVDAIYEILGNNWFDKFARWADRFARRWFNWDVFCVIAHHVVYAKQNLRHRLGLGCTLVCTQWHPNLMVESFQKTVCSWVEWIGPDAWDFRNSLEILKTTRFKLWISIGCDCLVSAIDGNSSLHEYVVDDPVEGLIRGIQRNDQTSLVRRWNL